MPRYLDPDQYPLPLPRPARAGRKPWQCWPLAHELLDRDRDLATDERLSFDALLESLRAGRVTSL